jgi:hypothetical protein
MVRLAIWVLGRSALPTVCCGTSPPTMGRWARFTSRVLPAKPCRLLHRFAPRPLLRPEPGHPLFASWHLAAMIGDAPNAISPYSDKYLRRLARVDKLTRPKRVESRACANCPGNLEVELLYNRAHVSCPSSEPRTGSSVKRSAIPTHDKPLIDEGSFQQLLSAAYVLQQHNERSHSGKPEEGYTWTLAGILDIQEQVRTQRLDLQASASLIARRIREFSQADGAAVGIVDHDQLEYYAASGSAAGQAGARAPIDSTLAAECLRSGQILQCRHAESDSRLSHELCRQQGVKALVAVPVSYQGSVAGVLELHFAQPDAFTEQDVRTCQLLGALLAEAIEIDRAPAQAPSAPDASPNDERAALLAALEKLKPQLERLAGSPKAATSNARPAGDGTELPTKRQSPAMPYSTSQPEMPATGTVCETCGHPLAEDETFCPSCGFTRRAPNAWASLWEMQRAAEAEKLARGGASTQRANTDVAQSDSLDVLPSEMEDIVARLSMEPAGSRTFPPERAAPTTQPGNTPSAQAYNDNAHAPLTWTFPHPADSTRQTAPDDDLPSFGMETLLPAADRDAYREDEPSSSAAKNTKPIDAPLAKTSWLAATWQAQRANVYVGVAALLLLAAITGWGTPETPAASSGSASTAHKQAHVPVQPELSFLDRMLIDLGVAEAPTAAADPGNPKAQVWVDVHTALYYCSGSEMYGKTPGGKLTTQQDAEQDQFQPAGRRPCN